MMQRHVRLPLALLLAAAGVFGCTSTETSVAPFNVGSMEAQINHRRIPATDSTLAITNTTFSDTAQVLTRLTPLAADLSVSATIGLAGGELKIDAAGVKLFIPPFALAAPTTITMKALAGSKVAYEFSPHGTQFRLPVLIRQDLRSTLAASQSSLLDDMHGSYFDTSLDDSYVDALNSMVRVKAHELGYFESNRQYLRFFIGHFSGYLVSCGITKVAGG
jgi:hypothetical protein